MNRRRFIQASAGLFAAAAPAVIRPSQAQILQFSGRPQESAGATIPLSFDDSRFFSNTAGIANQSVTSGGSQSNKTWNENPTYGNGESAFEWGSATGTYNLSLCNFDWRECIRIAGGSNAIFNIDQIFANTIGFGLDHADGVQGYSGAGGDSVNVTMTNSCLRSYSDAEAISVYGPSAIGSGGWFWADGMRGTITLNNVVIWGGQRGMAIYADTGTTTIDFQNLYFVPSPPGSGWDGYDYDIRATGGTLTVARWSNVRAATIVGGVIVPGALLPSP